MAPLIIAPPIDAQASAVAMAPLALEFVMHFRGAGQAYAMPPLPPFDEILAMAERGELRVPDCDEDDL